ncbi:glycosyl transferase family 90 [Pararhodobacter aggregans]
MELHDFMCPEVCPKTRQLRSRPGLLARYAPSTLMVADFEADRLFHQPQRRNGTVFETTIRDTDLQAALAPIRNKPHRAAELIAQLGALGARWAVADMADAAPFAPDFYLGFAANILQYNRRRGQRSAALWRLPLYYEPSARLGNWLDPEAPDDIDFADKLPRVYWRGATSAARWSTPYRLEQPALPQSLEDLAAQRQTSLRAAAVLYSLENRDITDFRFGLRPRFLRQLSSEARRAGFAAGRDPPTEAFRHRYVLCLPGNDVATQLYWVISTQSVAFVVDSDYECLPDYFLKPWVHYVPVQRNLGDLREKFEFCEANPDLCRSISERARAAYAAIRDPALWHEAELKVLDKLGFLA